ncbi:MAG: glycogen synthase GlgA [Clostridia bacterium]|nr:glycogen synthase GlgA [Clostridia bacterium]
MKVLFVSSEATPFALSGGLGEVAGALPQALKANKVDCRVILPLYGQIPNNLRKKMKFLTSFEVNVAWRSQYCGIFKAIENGVTYYFVDNEYYFKRDSLYGHYDDAERFSYFSRAVLEAISHIDFKPDILHCHDWQTALVPFYYSAFYYNRLGYENIKTVYTIHNIQYQGLFGKEILNELIGVSPDKYSLIEYDGIVNFSKSAIECANKVTTVSPTYANEIMDAWYSHGLDPILNQRSWKLCGILNGIDTLSYDPENDPDIFYKYSLQKKAGKSRNKKALQEHFDFEVNKNIPIICIVSRLVSHKGLDLIRTVIDELLYTTEVRIIVLGSGDSEYEDFFKGVAQRHPDKFRLALGFIPELSRKLYAGSDMLLMPSKSEPCGLSQLIALRYGTIPIVRETGGLKDTIFDCGDPNGNGFTFKTYDAYDMLWAINRAIDLYYNRNTEWKKLVSRALGIDHSWNNSALQYIDMYNDVLKD